MRKIKSTALLGAFVAVASVGVISHEAHGATTIGGFVTQNVSKEMLPNSVTLPAPVLYPSVPIPATTASTGYASITLTLSGASFEPTTTYSYSIVSGNTIFCVIPSGDKTSSMLNSLTLSCNASDLTSSTSLAPGSSYTIVGGGSSSSLVVYVPQSSSSIVLSYTSDAANDTPASVPLANVMPQLSVSPNSVTTAVISPSSGTLFTDSYSYATNTVVISNNEYSGQWTNKIDSTGSYTINFLFTNIPTSVTSVGAVDTNSSKQYAGPVTPVNQSATVSFSLNTNYAPFVQSSSSDTIYFSFTNSGNIQLGTIVLSSIIGSDTLSGSTVSYVYSSTTQPFINFQYTGVQIYVPDALAPDNNEIRAGYITISMPSSASIASISVLNNPNASCPLPTAANGSFTSTSGVSYIDLSKLAPLCTGLDSKAWGSGVPLVITISGSGVSPNTVTADAYAVINGFGLKRIPVNVISGNGPGFFSY